MEVRDKLKAKSVKLLYVAPETLTREEFLSQFATGDIDLIAIDEAHCISTWGHDFRPEYRLLRNILDRFPEAVCFALTATATKRVRQDICNLLKIPLENQFIESFNRKNLLLTVEPKQNAYPRLLNFLASHKSESGLIYCFTRKHVDDLADRLQTDGYSVLPYHAGLSDLERTQNQEAFIRDEVKSLWLPLLLVWASINPISAMWFTMIFLKAWKHIIRKSAEADGTVCPRFACFCPITQNCLPCKRLSGKMKIHNGWSPHCNS